MDSSRDSFNEQSILQSQTLQAAISQAKELVEEISLRDNMKEKFSELSEKKQQLLKDK